MSQTASGVKGGNNVEGNEPSSKRVRRLPVPQMDRRSPSFLMTGNLIENPLLCRRANNQVQRGRGTALALELTMKYQRAAGRERKEGEERRKVGGRMRNTAVGAKRKQRERESNKKRAQIWMEEGRITDWTEIKRLSHVRVRKEGEIKRESEEKGEGKESRVKSELSSLPRAQFPDHD